MNSRAQFEAINCRASQSPLVALVHSVQIFGEFHSPNGLHSLTTTARVKHQAFQIYPLLVENMKKKAIAALLLTQTMLFGCASYNYTDAPPTLGMLYSKYAYMGYAGEPKPIEDVGIVTTDGLIKISMVDGQPISSYKVFKTSGMYSGGRYQLHLLPGTHVLSMGFHDDRGNGSRSWSTSDLTRTISIAKGQVIHLSLAGGSGRNTWTAKESDGSSVLPLITSDFKELKNTK